MGEEPPQQQEQQTELLPDPEPESQTLKATTEATTSLETIPLQAPPKTRPRKVRKLDIKSDVVSTSNASSKKLTPHRTLPVPSPARSLTAPNEINIALNHLRSVDPRFSPLIDIHQPPSFDTCRTPFLALTRSILYQQLAFKAGTSIFTRFISLCGGEEGVIPETVLALNANQLRQIGVSGRKASYLHDLARKYSNGILSDESILNMDDKSLFTMLTMVNGIGSWSVHMFMIFSLHRPDVLPVNDGSIRKGVQFLYGLEELPRPSQMEQLCEKWRPYRSVASWYLWRLVEAKAAPLSGGGTAASLQQQQSEQQQQQQQQFLDPNYSILHLGACFALDGNAMGKTYESTHL